MFGSGVWLFTTAYLLSVASAGPGVAALVSRAITTGWRGIPSFVLGFVAGDLIWFAGAITGVSALAQRASSVLIVLKYAGAAFLLYLAYRMWTSRVRVSDERPPDVQPNRLFLASFFLTLGNPKPMMFFLAVVPTVVDLDNLTLADTIGMLAAIPFVLFLVMFTYVFIAVRARGLFAHERSFRLLNRCGAVVMTGAALFVLIN